MILNSYDAARCLPSWAVACLGYNPGSVRIIIVMMPGNPRPAWLSKVLGFLMDRLRSIISTIDLLFCLMI